MLKRTLLILLLVSGFCMRAQDIHFSNFYTNVLNVNPALTGFYKGKFRFSGTVRDQYRTVAIPYQTASLSFDAALKNFIKRGSETGYGILINYDIAGDSRFSTVQASIPLAIHIKDYSKTLFYSFGIMPGFIHNTLEYAYLKFPDQFDGEKYDPSIGHGEDPNLSNKTSFNLNAGFHLHWKINKNNNLSVGFSANNLTAPDMSYYDGLKVKLPRRWLAHLSANVYVGENIDLIPSAKIQFQGTQQEYQFGLMAMYYTQNRSIPMVYGGAWMRSKNYDAVILGVGLNYLGIDVILNYDINLSSLKNASNGHGAFELSLTYIVFDSRKRGKMKAVKCPGYL